MSHPYHHAVSSAKRFGGTPEDYLDIHSWMDETKSHFADVRHRAMRHHSEGIFMAEREFGVTIKNSNGRDIPVRLIAEQHVREDCGFIPTMADWLQHMSIQPWMSKSAVKLSKELQIEKRNERQTTTKETPRSVCSPRS